MRLCSSCFRDATLLNETEDTNVNGFRYRSKSKQGVQTRFYCCGRIPPEGFHKKRHGMFQNKDLSKDGSVELAVEAYEYESLSFTKTVDPSVPYVEDLPDELYQGRAIEIQAKLLENANRFSINLSTGKDNEADLALHFNPRFDRHIIIRNHRIKGKWGVEEIVSLQLFPFKSGKNFSVLIFVADEQFLIAVNKVHYCAFAFRLPVEKIKSLIILGDIALGLVQHCERTYYPPRIFKKIPTVVVPHFLEGTKCDIRRKVKEIKVGTKIDIFGRLKLLPRAFYVNLQKGIALWPHPIIPFHMNLRLYSPGTQKREKEIIFNSWSNGIWGKEEVISYCPFLPGTGFHLKLICTSNGYTVHVNDKILFNFESQDKSNIDSVVIHGDVVINKVVIH